ncbi:MAG: hypothetical protein AB1651_10675 [Pseudomonadota bacterium]
MKTRTVLSTLVLASALLGFNAAARADDGLGQRVATGVGRVIAAQGNAALQQIREELRETLEDRLAPYLPVQDVGGSAAAGTASGDAASTPAPL